MERGLEAPADATGEIGCTTSGDPEVFSALMRRIGWAAVPVEQGLWDANGTPPTPL
jgi:hypothetical protein